MAEHLRLDGVALRSGGPTASLALLEGQRLGIIGTDPAGVSAWMQVVVGGRRPASGIIKISSEVRVPLHPGRAKGNLSAWIRKATGDEQERTPQAIADLNLWDLRNEPLQGLSESGLLRTSLLPAVAAADGCLCLDHTLDTADPWTVASVLASVERFIGRGGSLVLGTVRPDLLEDVDLLLVLKGEDPVFADRPEVLWRRGSVTEIEVATKNMAAVRALVEPFEVRVTEVPAGIKLEAREGQELAARLLRDGYGDIRYLVTRRPTLAEVIRDLVR